MTSIKNNSDEIDDFSDLFKNLKKESTENAEITLNALKPKSTQTFEVDDLSDFFRENKLTTKPSDIIRSKIDKTELTGLFGDIVKEYESNKPKNIMLKRYNYMNLLDEEKINPKFLKVFDNLVGTAAQQGHVIHPILENQDDLVPSYHYSQEHSQYSLFRADTKYIEELLYYIEEHHNSKCQAKKQIIFDPAFPESYEMEIDPDAERCNRRTYHLGLDLETNPHQKLYEERYKINDAGDYIDIPSGAMGLHFLEAKRYVEYYHTRYQKDSFLEYHTEQNGNTFIRIQAPDPLEAILIAITENSLAQFLLSAVADGQKELITLFKEFADKITYPINTTILREYLHHENFDNISIQNAKFDLNRILETRSRHKQKGFQFLLEETEPHVLPLMYGNITEKQEGRIFHCKQGNLQPGIRTKLMQNIKYNRTDGVPEIYLAPIQRQSDYSSYATDTLVLAKAGRVPPGERGLKELSKSTNFPALDDSKMKLTDKQFIKDDFHITKNNKLSKASHYLYRDCIATIAVYGKLTKILALKDLEQATNVELTHTFFKKFPYIKYIISTATQSKDFLKADIAQKTGLSIQQIEFNLKNQRKFFSHWINIKDNFYKDDEPWCIETPIFQAGKVSTWIYGFVTSPNPNYPDFLIKLLDFVSQYPHMAWLGATMKMLYLAGVNRLNEFQSTDVQELEKRFWYAIDWILKEIHSKGVIPHKALIYLNGIANVQLKRFFLMRDNNINITYPKGKPFKKPKIIRKCDKYIKGHRKLFLSELAHAVIRYYELYNADSKWKKLTHKQKLSRLKSFIRFKEGEFINFTAEDVPTYGEELYTMMLVLRKQVKELAKTDHFYDILQDKIKYNLTNLFGSTAEGISKEFIGKLLCPPVPTTITGLAKFVNNLSEIYLRKHGGLPLYTHTDSLGAYATQKAFDIVQKLFQEIDPHFLDSQESKLEYQKIDFFLGIGKAKYAFHSAVTDTWTFTTAGSGVYGYSVNGSYEEMARELRLKKSIKNAVLEAIIKFPKSYQVTNIKTYKQLRAQLQTIKRMIGKYPNEILEINPKSRIYGFDEIDIKESTSKTTGKITNRKTHRKLFITTNDLGWGNFTDYRNIAIPKIDKKKRREKRKLLKQLKRLAKADPKKWRGWSKLKKINDIKTAVRFEQLPAWCVPKYLGGEGTTITAEATKRAKQFVRINPLAMQHLLNLVEKLTGDIQIEDIESMDNSLEYSELKTELLAKYGKDKSDDELEEDTYFAYSKQLLEEEYEAGKITEASYNSKLKELYQEFNKNLSMREYISPYPKGANFIILANSVPLEFDEYFSFILNNSKLLTDHEKLCMEKDWIKNPKGTQHLTNRYTFNPNYYLANPTPKYQAIINKELKKRYKTKTKRNQMKNKIVSELIFTEHKLDFIELEPKREFFDERGIGFKSIPKNELKSEINSDMFVFNQHFFVTDFAITEYQMGNKNRAHSQALENTSRTMSCEHARTHIQDPKVLDMKIRKYLFQMDADKLPCPKGRSITSDNMRGFTTRMRFKAVPIFDVKEKDSVDSKFFDITFYDFIKEWLENNIIEVITPKLYLINKPAIINETMNNIRKYEWFTFDFFKRKWTFEIKEYTDADVNGMYYIGGVVGKNLCVNISMRFNPTSSKMLNLKLFPCTPSQLEKESIVIKEITNRIIQTNTLTSFTRSASMTNEDYKAKKNPTDILDKVYLVLAQINIETQAKQSITQLTQLDIADDIIAKNSNTAKWVIRFLNFAMHDAYEELTSNIDTLKNEIAFQRRISVGCSRKLTATDCKNPGRSRYHVGYVKARTQILNKAKSVFAEYKTPDDVFTYLEKQIKDIHNIIRIETHLASRKAITDPKSYERHQTWKELVVAVIDLVNRILKESDNIIKVFNSLIAEIKPLAKAFIYKNAQDIYETPPIPPPMAYS